MNVYNMNYVNAIIMITLKISKDLIAASIVS